MSCSDATYGVEWTAKWVTIEGAAKYSGWADRLPTKVGENRVLANLENPELWLDAAELDDWLKRAGSYVDPHKMP